MESYLADCRKGVLGKRDEENIYKSTRRRQEKSW
jgi:hypothetical protein